MVHKLPIGLLPDVCSLVLTEGGLARSRCGPIFSKRGPLSRIVTHTFLAPTSHRATQQAAETAVCMIQPQFENPTQLDRPSTPITMEFERSTQEKSWMFSEESIAACRRRAVADPVEKNTRRRSSRAAPAERVRKFASGFHRQHTSAEQTPSQNDSPIQQSQPPISGLPVDDQETLVRFHAHQIQTLVGPQALLTDCRTSQTVLSTAIMFFRRFYLSNSVVDINPRKIAAACAFFASKCEDEGVEVSSYIFSIFPSHGGLRHGRAVCCGGPIFASFFSGNRQNRVFVEIGQLTV